MSALHATTWRSPTKRNDPEEVVSVVFAEPRDQRPHSLGGVSVREFSGCGFELINELGKGLGHDGSSLSLTPIVSRGNSVSSGLNVYLTPTEAAAVTRFGIHDDGVLTDMEEHTDKPVPCLWKYEDCAAPASWSIARACCGLSQGTICTTHLQRWMRRVVEKAGAPRRCARCGAHVTLGPHCYRVVPL